MRLVLAFVVLVSIVACSAAAPDAAPAGESSSTGVVSTSTSAPTTSAGSTTSGPAATTSTTVADPVGDFVAAITSAERGIRDVDLPAAETARWGRTQQRTYRRLADSPELDEAVRAQLPADVLVAFDANVAARRAVVDHAATRPPSEPADTLPAWTIVDPRPIDELLGYYREAEAATGVPWTYLAAINLVETRIGRISGVSSAGAVGPMQFLPETWAACCSGDVLDPHDAIIGAATYLVAKGAPGDMAAALYGYNPNNGYVGAVQAYALNMTVDPRAYDGYHAWEVYVATTAGTVRLPVGFSATEPIDAAAYLAEHPADRAPVDD